MIIYFKKNASILSLLIVGLTVVVYSYQNRLRGESWKQVVDSDGRGYYAYLPAIFINQDWEWDFVFNREKQIYSNDPEMIGNYIRNTNGEKINKYFIGTSILLSPFFLSALTLSKVFGYNTDGYSILFMYAIVLAAIFYLLLGLNYARKTLLLYGLNEISIALTIIGFGLGTNLFYYTCYEPSLSHVYSFSLISIFCYHAKIISIKYNNKSLVFLLGLLGLILITRPVNVIIILVIPFFFDSFTSFFEFIKTSLRNYKTIILGLTIATIIISTQLIVYYLQSGKFWIYTYTNEKFVFSEPHFFDILFSYKKGLFIYTPICFISLLGIIVLFRKNIFQAFSSLLFFIICTYILSSWYCWWYGGSYGLRAFIEFFPFLLILLGIAINYSKRYRIFISLFLCICIWLNFIQIYQYHNNILHWESMNKEKYWNVFLKTDDIYKGVLFEKEYTDEYKNVSNDLIFESNNTYENIDSNWTSSNIICLKVAHSGNKVSLINERFIYGGAFIYKVPKNFNSLIVKVNSFFNLISHESKGKLIVSLEKNGVIKDYNFRFTHSIFNEIPLNEWQNFSYNVKFSDLSTGDEIKIYFMNSGLGNLYIDDMKVSIYNDPNERQLKTKEYFVNQIKIHPDWLKQIQEKAIKMNTSTDEMIFIDASFLENQDKEIASIENEIKKDESRFRIVKNLAKENNRLLSVVLNEEAKKIYLAKKSY